MLLFKILETSKDPVVRSNIVIALGDIAVCFGNLIDDVSTIGYFGVDLAGVGCPFGPRPERRFLVFHV